MYDIPLQELKTKWQLYSLHIVKLLWSWLFQMGSHYRHLSANAWSPLTDGFKWGVHCQICQFLSAMGICALCYVYISERYFVLLCVLVLVERKRERSEMVKCSPYEIPQFFVLPQYIHIHIYAVVVAVFKASVLDWWRVHLPAIYTYAM